MKRNSDSRPIRLSLLNQNDTTDGIESQFAISSKVYIGPSKTLEDDLIHVAVTDVSVGSGTSPNRSGLTCSRVFGEDLKFCGNSESENTLLSETLKEILILDQLDYLF